MTGKKGETITAVESGMPDVEKLQPVVFSMFDNRYWALGKFLGKAWSVGKDHKGK